MRRYVLIALATALAFLAAGLAAFHWIEAPTTLRISVGPPASEDARLVTAIAQYLAREREPVRLKLVPTDSVAASADAVDAGKADLAVVRSDVAMPLKAQTVVILHRDAAVLLTTPETGVKQVSDLQGRKVGILHGMPANARLFETILAHYELARDAVAIVPIASPAEAEEALRAKRIDAVMAVGTLIGRGMTETVAAVARAAGAPPVFIPVGEADAVAQRSPIFESFEIVRGAFGGTPPRPAETVTTLGVSHRLVAEAELDENTIAELTRLLFVMRPAIAAEVPLANRIEGPDTSKSSSLPLHPGAAAYYEGEVQTFMERYSDLIYLGAMFGGAIGSGLVALLSTAQNRRRSRIVSLLNDLLAIVQASRTAASETELAVLEQEADAILVAALSKAGEGAADATNLVAFQLGLDQARRAIADRRAWLAGHAHLRSAAE